MLAKLVDQPFDDPAWLFEMKYDGYRALAVCDGEGSAEIYSRNLLPLDKKFPPIVEGLRNMQYPCLLDGEIVVEDQSGLSDFQLLQNYQLTQKGKIKYYVFDLLGLNGEDTTGLPLSDRKELLEALLKKQKLKSVFYSPHIVGKGIRFFAKARKQGWEGIVAKKMDSSYQPRRNGDWLKIKLSNEQEAVIAGITAPQGSRVAFGSLLLAAYNSKKELEYLGSCGTGFDTAMLNHLYKLFKPLFVSKSPFKENVRPGAKVQWLKPITVCQVKFTEWTQEGHMRHPVFLGLRTDKKPAEVKREKPEK